MQTCGQHPENSFPSSRRQFIKQISAGFGLLAAGEMLAEADTNSLEPRLPPLRATAKRVCHLYMSGGMSQQDHWDYKPKLQTIGNQSKSDVFLLPSPFSFKQYGQSGKWMSEVWPRLSRQVDDIAFINSTYTEIPDHDLGTMMQTTGDARAVKPSVGSWVVYGLGTVNQNLPAFIALSPGGEPIGKQRNWDTAFLPSNFQGTFIDTAEPDTEKLIANIRSQHVSQKEQRRQLDLLGQLNEIHRQANPGDSRLEARLKTFETAYQMQTEATDAFDISKESEQTRQRYGITDGMGISAQGRQMLIARRMLERGVRYVQAWNGGWDHHSDVAGNARRTAYSIDQPVAAFLADLKQRGMLQDTLVVCSTEFGRTSVEDGAGGRGHNHRAFTSWLAGGGIRGGQTYGATDELGQASVVKPVSVHELHATILHALGFDPQQLTFRFNGRDFRLIDVSNAKPLLQLFS